ncbi:MAG: alpha-N-arabinofuranosidase [Chloroflexota bacterium]|nr:MAG: alpha-N-arabinofuranosidase [Chloroflexota bacterium]
MDTTQITLHNDYQVAPVDPRIFGGFLEHWGRAIYQGIYQPDSVHADQNGFRKDVLDALSKMGMTVMRYPGGNFASGYHWLDGVGLPSSRPTIRELAWQSIEPNQFGTDEFMALARQMDWMPMLTVNLGTGTPEEARNWVEYCNCPTGTRYASMRAENGSATPYGVKLWCLGNEMDGPWQLGHIPAHEYAIRAQQAAKLMKDADPDIELVACGTCAIDLPTYLEWDRIVLEYVGKDADYVSLHRYVGNPTGAVADYLAVTGSIDRQIEEMDAVCRYVQARKRSQKRAYLCFDEWNIWYRTMNSEHINGRGQLSAHLAEEEYDLADALVVAGFLNSFIRHADVVKIANLAQIVNTIAPLHTRGEDLLLHTIYYPFAMYSQRRDGVSLHPLVKGPGYTSASYGPVKYIDTSAILGEDILHIFLTNRSLSEIAPVTIDFIGGQLEGLVSAEMVTGPAAQAQNTYEHPWSVCSQPFNAVQVKNGTANLNLPPLSVAALTFKLAAHG